ncbi:MAG TPA: hypothetical protein VGF48_24000 [Thermoanaerobaculia bacterium]|jgi:hypothetical protein
MLLLLLAMLSASPSAIDVTVRGTNDPIEARLMVRDDDRWQEVRTVRLPAETRRIQFDELPAGVYQLLLQGDDPTEQLATPVVLGNGDHLRSIVIIEPMVLAGHLTHRGADLAGGSLFLHRADDNPWQAPIAIAGDGTFLVPLWQRGSFLYTVRAPALTTPWSGTIELRGASPIRFAVDIPGQKGITVQSARR